MTSSLCNLSAGELRGAPLAALLLEALRSRATGVLELDAGGGTSRVYLRGGSPCGAQVFVGFKSFGHFLLDLGWIDIDGLERSLAAVAAGRKQGEVLVEMGLLTEERLHLALGLHQQAQLRTLANLDSGTYRFLPGPDLPAWTATVRLSAHRAVVDALTAASGHGVAARILAGIPARQGLVLREGWERAAGQFRLDAWEERLVARFVRSQEVDRVAGSGLVPPEKARALAACLFLMGLARPAPVEAAPAPPAEPPPVAPAVRAPAPPVETLPPSAVPPPPGPPPGWESEAEPFELELGACTPGAFGLGATGTPGPSGLPGATPGPAVAADERLRRLQAAQEREVAAMEAARRAAEAEEREARLEREEADRRQREAARTRPAPEFRSDPAEARARRARMLKRAFGNIPWVPEPVRSAAESTPPRPHVSGGVVVESIPARPPPERTPPRPERTGPGDLAALARRIEEKHARVAGEDHFARLGVPRNAPRDAVKRAFFEAAKTYHPDRLAPELAHLASAMQEIFTAVNEAYELLQDEERRRAYERQLEGGQGGSVDEQLRLLVSLAETAMRRRAFAEAERAYRQAAGLKDRPDLHAHAAWAAFNDPARADDAGRARTELASIAARNPKAAVPHYYLGVIARSEGDDDRAERHLRDALRANPKYAEAAQELRLVEARRRGGGGR